MEHLEVTVPATRTESSSSITYEMQCVATVHSAGLGPAEQRLRWSKHRRYSEFFELRAVLTDTFGDDLGLLPAFPGKSLLSSASLVESRREQLQEYMQALARVPLVREFEIFLRFLGAPTAEPRAELTPRSRTAPEPEQALARNGAPLISLPLEPETPPRPHHAPAILNTSVELEASVQGGGLPADPTSPDASQTKELLRAFYSVYDPASSSDDKLDSLIHTYRQKAMEVGDGSVGGWRSLLFGNIAKDTGVHPLEHWQHKLDSAADGQRITPRRVKFRGAKPRQEPEAKLQPEPEPEPERKPEPVPELEAELQSKSEPTPAPLPELGMEPSFNVRAMEHLELGRKLQPEPKHEQEPDLIDITACALDAALDTILSSGVAVDHSTVPLHSTSLLLDTLDEEEEEEEEEEDEQEQETYRGSISPHVQGNQAGPAAADEHADGSAFDSTLFAASVDISPSRRPRTVEGAVPSIVVGTPTFVGTPPGSADIDDAGAAASAAGQLSPRGTSPAWEPIVPIRKAVLEEAAQAEQAASIPPLHAASTSASTSTSALAGGQNGASLVYSSQDDHQRLPASAERAHTSPARRRLRDRAGDLATRVEASSQASCKEDFGASSPMGTHTDIVEADLQPKSASATTQLEVGTAVVAASGSEVDERESTSGALPANTEAQGEMSASPSTTTETGKGSVETKEPERSLSTTRKAKVPQWLLIPAGLSVIAVIARLLMMAMMRRRR